MIYTTLNHLERYRGLNPNLDAVISFATTHDLHTLNLGRNEIAGDDAYVNVFDDQSVPLEDAIWEGHERYGDVHLVLSGTEKIGVSDAAALQVTQRKPEEDFIGFEGPVQVWAPLAGQAVLVVFPEDAHMVKVADGSPAEVKKVVFKFKVTQEA